MNLNKNETDWIRLIARERLSKIRQNILDIKDHDDRKWYAERSLPEIEVLERVIEKSEKNRR